MLSSTGKRGSKSRRKGAALMDAFTTFRTTSCFSRRGICYVKLFPAPSGKFSTTYFPTSSSKTLALRVGRRISFICCRGKARLIKGLFRRNGVTTAFAPKGGTCTSCSTAFLSSALFTIVRKGVVSLPDQWPLPRAKRFGMPLFLACT